MSRWIDADAVKSIIRSGVSTDTEADKEYVCERIDEAPTIDIVRCEKCEHWRHNPNSNEYGVCSKVSYGEFEVVMHADDFCSYGEREGE